MLLTTKYNINDTVFYFDITKNYKGKIIQDNGIQPTIIMQIVVEEYDYYYVTDAGNFRESELFATKDEAEKWKQSLEKQECVK